MHATDIIGYAYGADVHCTHCTPAVLKRPDATDADDNPVHPIFASDADADDVCGDCGERLDGGPRPRRRPAQVYCLLDGARGQYLPQAFAQHYRIGGVTGIDDAAWDILAAGPEHAQYWDTWADVLDAAELRSNEGAFTLYQDGDLFAVESGAQYDDRTGEWYVEV